MIALPPLCVSTPSASWLNTLCMFMVHAYSHTYTHTYAHFLCDDGGSVFDVMVKTRFQDYCSGMV
ncbi:hypothetical protein EON63_11560 [archaeon]|nr:MAG: hypothetical protein EON63_11560 [archaeon]